MAFREGPTVFHDSSLPVLQLVELWLEFERQPGIRLYTYQNDDVFGLAADSTSKFAGECSNFPPHNDSIYRHITMDTLPSGEIRDVAFAFGPRSDLSELLLDVDGTRLLLLMAEVEQQTDGSLRVRKDDESILLVCPPELRAAIPWYPG